MYTKRTKTRFASRNFEWIQQKLEQVQLVSDNTTRQHYFLRLNYNR